MALARSDTARALRLALLVLVWAAPGPANCGAQIESLWTLPTGSWFNASHWSPPGVPNNTAEDVFNVTFATFNLVSEVDQSVTINRLTLNGGVIQRSAGIPDPVRFEALEGVILTSVASVVHQLKGLDFFAAGGVLGGGNVKKLDELPKGCRRGANEMAYVGGIRMWEPVENLPSLAVYPEPQAQTG